jgi:hypothetical protein
MLPNIQDTRQKIANASRHGWDKLNRDIESGANNDLVDVEWDVIYDELGHDIILQAKIKVRTAEDVLLQIWLEDQHPGIGIPEFRPWVASVVEFKLEQQVREALVGLFDSKWRTEDVGETYDAMLWGYLMHNGTVESFAFKRKFKYPG